MQARTRLVLSALAATLLVGGATAWVRSRAQAPSEQVPARDGAVKGLLYAEPFALARPYAHDWRLEAPRVDGGWILVLEVERDVAVRRQLAEPVLYVGDQTAERINHGDLSGRLIAIVPGDFDPAVDPAWFGEPALPEQIDAAAVARELAAARAAGLPPLARAAATRRDALVRSTAALPDRTALHRRAAELVLRWAPEERDLAEGLLVPLVE
jgi:hypothetical protein